MGFLRGATITVFSILFFVCLILMNLSLILSLSLNHDTLQPALKSSATEILKDFLGSGSMFSEEEQPYIKNYCMIDSEYRFDYENYNFTFPCEVIENGTDSIIDYGADYFVNTLYYGEYNCEFWQCVKESSIPFVLLSDKARDYWNGKFFLLGLLSLVLFALIFLISRNRPVTFIVAGALLIISALPFRKLDWALNFVPEKLSGIFSVFFTKAHDVFIIIFVIGIIFIIFGILSLIFGWKMRKLEDSEENVSKSEVRNIVKEEMLKKKKK